MTTMVRRARDAAQVLAAAADVLVAAEGEHTALYAHLGRLHSQPDPEAYLAIVERNGEVIGCAGGTPETRVAVSHLDLDAAAIVAADLAAEAPHLKALLAPIAIADAIAQDIGGRTSRVPSVAMAQRHFQADAVTPPRGVGGALRRAGEGDRPTLERWIGAFIVEALHDDPARAPASVERWLTPGDDGHLVLWEDAGQPVSLAGFMGPTPTGITVLSVYTPPELRGRGYASACVAALTQHLLDSGRQRVFL